MTNYPLAWPAGWRRTKKRKDATFRRDRQHLSIADGVKRVIAQLHRLGIAHKHIIISTNVKPRLDGMPSGDSKQPEDPGAAVYWKKENDLEYKTMGVDQYSKVADNLAAIAATLEAMRAIERHGGAVIMERAFSGFLSLPAPNTWRAVFGYQEDAGVSLDRARADYRDLSKQRHPDRGGSDATMAELNWAMQNAEQELGR